MNQAARIEAPQPLRDWQQQLSPLALPVDPAVKSAALAKLGAPSGNAGNVTDILMRDPALVLRIVHTANKSLMRTGNELHSLSHAISLLGFPHTEKLLRDAAEYQSIATEQHQQYRQQLSISLHAAWQLEGWTHVIPRWSQDGLFLATLLQRAPLWALWAQAPELMMELRRLRWQNRGGGHPFLEKQVLGCTLQALAANLCRQWQLPTLTQRSWFPSERGHHRQWIMLSRIIPEQAQQALARFPDLHRLTTSSSFAIALANRLADEVDWDWYSHRSERLQRILATCLHQPLATAVAISHRQAVQACREYQLADTLNPARQLLSYYQRTVNIEQIADVPEAKDSDESLAPEDDIDSAETASLLSKPPTLAELIQRLRKHPQGFSSLPELFNQSLKLLCRDVRLERACAILLHGPSRELRTFFNSGCEDYPALREFRHRPQRRDLFNKMLQKPLSARLHADNYLQLTALLPPAFKQACSTDQFFMMSIFAGDKPIGIIYADRGISGHSLGNSQYTLFKQLCSAVSHCLSERLI